MPEIDWKGFDDWSSRTWPSELTNRFDWQLWPSEVHSFPGHRRVKDPQTVYALPKAVGQLLESAARDFDNARSNRVVVFGGDETPLSRAFGHSEAAREQTVHALQKWFSSIFYYVKDVEVEGVLTMPVGLAHFHLPGRPASIAAAKAIAGARLDEASKSKSVLVSFSVGSHSDHLEMATLLSEEDWGNMFARLHFEAPSQAIAAAAFGQRLELAEWAQTEVAAALGAEFRRVQGGIGRWWEELARYKFLACPFGSAIQSIKIFEALMVLTVPIVKRGAYPIFDGLLRLGFPLAIVDDWGEVTPARLDLWWQSLAGRLPSFRRNCLTSAGLWHLFTSSNHSCH